MYRRQRADEAQSASDRVSTQLQNEEWKKWHFRFVVVAAAAGATVQISSHLSLLTCSRQSAKPRI